MVCQKLCQTSVSRRGSLEEIMLFSFWNQTFPEKVRLVPCQKKPSQQSMAGPIRPFHWAPMVGFSPHRRCFAWRHSEAFCVESPASRLRACVGQPGTATGRSCSHKVVSHTACFVVDVFIVFCIVIVGVLKPIYYWGHHLANHFGFLCLHIYGEKKDTAEVGFATFIALV